MSFVVNPAKTSLLWIELQFLTLLAKIWINSVPVLGRAPPSGVRQHSAEWTDAEGVDDVEGANHHPVKRGQPRRHHTLAGDHASMDLPHNAMDAVESHLVSHRSHSLYQPPPSVYDDDPGIMSEVETSATGFRRASKARSSLPIVRTPSKTQERPLGLVFLQYRNETKRALLPNEITTMDTVRALFVRSFPKQLTMEYLDSPHIRVYIHDPAKDMFYELEDLRDIRDRSVLRIYEQDVNGGGVYSTWDPDSSYFSEPEFDSEFQHQHIHRTKSSKSQSQASNYYGTVPGPFVPLGRTQTLPHGASMRPFSPAPPERQKPQSLPPAGFSQTLPRGTHLLSYTPAPPSPEKRQKDLLMPPAVVPGGPSMPVSPERRHEPQGAYRTTPERPYSATGHAPGFHPLPERRYDPPYHSSPDRRSHDAGYLSSPERRLEHQRSFPGYTSSSYEESFYGGGDRMYGSRSGSVTPVVDEEARIRVEYMERQLANLTGLVQKALAAGTPGRHPQHVPTRDTDLAGREKPDECREVETEVARHPFKVDADSGAPTPQLTPQPSFSSDKEARSAGGKPAPPPKPTCLLGASTDNKQHGSSPSKELHLTPELYSQLRQLRKKTKDLRLEVRNLRRMAQAQAVTARETVRETCLKIKAMLAAAQDGEDQVRAERQRVSREEDLYRQDVTRLEKDLSELESQVEELRSNVINRRCRVNMSDVEGMALVLSRASKTVADLKARFPNLQESLKAVMAAEMEVVVREEKFLKEEPERLENALRRCKKLTGTLVTLKRIGTIRNFEPTDSSTPRRTDV